MELFDILPASQELPDDLIQGLNKALSQSFSITDEGGIDWNTRPYAKKWYLPRRGRAGITAILESLPIAPKDRLVLLLIKYRRGFALTWKHIQRVLMESLGEETHLLMLAASGKYLLELDPEGYLYFDFSIVDEKDIIGYFGACPI